MLFRSFRSFEDGETVTGEGFDIVMERRRLGRLAMPTGSLVACDPMYGLETEPFEVTLECGKYPVILFAAQLRDETLPAYAMLKVGEKEPTDWEIATVVGETPEEANESGGYPVEDEGLGSFMDAGTAKALMDYTHAVMPDDDDYRRAMRRQVFRRGNDGYSWANIHLQRDANISYAPHSLNVIAFDAGFGDGLYTTYIGRDDEGDIQQIVTDFDVLDFNFRRRLRRRSS